MLMPLAALTPNKQERLGRSSALLFNFVTAILYLHFQQKIKI